MRFPSIPSFSSPLNTVRENHLHSSTHCSDVAFQCDEISAVEPQYDKLVLVDIDTDKYFAVVAVAMVMGVNMG